MALRLGSISTVSPLAVLLDGDTDPTPVEVTIIHADYLNVGQRVVCEMRPLPWGAMQSILLGVAGGTGKPVSPVSDVAIYRRSSTQAVAASTWTTLAYNTVQQAPVNSSWISTNLTTGFVTINTAGLYGVHANWTAGTQCAGQLRSPTELYLATNDRATELWENSVGIVRHFAAGQQILLSVRAGAATNIAADNGAYDSVQTRLRITRIPI